MPDLYPDADRPGIIVIATPHDRDAMAESVRAAGGRVVTTLDWRDADLSQTPAARIVLANARDAAEPALTDTLAQLADLAAARDAAIVMVFDRDQIDVVTATLFGPMVDLLCDPDPGMVSGAIALAMTRREDRLADTVREGEAERLRRLNEEVARVAEVLARLTGYADRRPGGVADRQAGFGAPPGAAAVTAADLRRAIRARRLRDTQFPGGLFEDPAWDILLDLYAAELEGAQVSVSSLCIAAAVAPTTALRWIGRMTEAGLLDRRPDPFDRRRAFMVLSADGRDRMQRYFAALAQNNLSIG